jgi:propanol-preferring alcohol dehydrogenase
MLAMQLNAPHTALTLVDLPIPTPNPRQILIRIIACAICRTDLHILNKELPDPHYPIIPGHQIVGTIVNLGSEVSGFKINQLVGIPWLGDTCGTCNFCKNGQENLCASAKYTGYNLNGGFAEYCVANANFCFNLPQGYDPIQVAPLLCAGLIGYRSYKKLPVTAQKIAIYGFGASAHIITQVATYLGKQIYAITKPNDVEAQDFARKLGAVWAGSTLDIPPCLFDGAIIYAPSGELVPLALAQLNKGGVLVCAGIHMSDIPSFKYELLWGERTICSVANLTVADGKEFLELAPKIPIHTHITTYKLAQANLALEDLAHGRFTGSGVIVI